MCKALQGSPTVCLHAAYVAAVTKAVSLCELTFLALVLAQHNESVMEVPDVLEISLL